MPSPFLSSEEYDERAHQLYNEGLYDEALDVLREGLALYPNSVELHIGVGYARLAREEFVWARRSFEQALILEPEHEDALAGHGETLLKFGQRDQALKSFDKILDLGYGDDLDLILQVGRTLFREHDDRRMPLMEQARAFFQVAVDQAPEMAEAAACLGYARHRLGDDQGAIVVLRRALQLDNDLIEARIYLANILYDRQEFEAALYHLDRTSPEDHWDELAIERFLELKRAIHRAADDDPDLGTWRERLTELSGDLDDIDEMLAEIEQRTADDAEATARGQLELFGALLTDLVDQREHGLHGDEPPDAHRVRTTEGREFGGTWEDIVREMRDADPAFAGRSVQEFIRSAAQRWGITAIAHDPETFIRASASAGLLKIVR
ncbi:MAG TPA: tetratricopeptide repeat protein [Gemmatimonadaceae bacterium]|nr:tetratricopeptide repeat protein [Gemmatimonadaceae bacterium]